jgi:hypothetical protein
MAILSVNFFKNLICRNVVLQSPGMLVCVGGRQPTTPGTIWVRKNRVVGTHMFLSSLVYSWTWLYVVEVVTVAFTFFILRPVSLVFFPLSYPMMRTTTASKFIAQLFFLISPKKSVDDKFPQQVRLGQTP